MLQRSSFGTGRNSASKEVVSQGVITFNAGSGEADANARLASTSTTRFAPNVALGPDPKAHLHPRKYQPMMISRKLPKQAVIDARISRNLAGYKLEPFASFNAYDHGGKSKEEIESELMCVGFAANTITYGEQTQLDGGLAIIVRGSFSTRNTSNTTWTPGMLLKWEAYHMRPKDADKLRMWEDAHQRSGGYTEATPRGYYPPVLTEFSYDRDVRLAMTNALRIELGKATVDSKDAAELFNFALLEDPNERRKLSATRLLVMRKIRADFLFLASLGSAETTDNILLGFGFGSLVGKPLSDTGSLKLAAQLQNVYGLSGPLSFGDEVTIPGLKEKMVQLAGSDGNSSYEVAVEAILAATQRITAVSLDFALPGANGAICV